MQYFHKGSFTHHTISRLDVDECVEGIDSCDASSTMCRNIPGGHECICKSGYDQNNGTKCTGSNIIQTGNSKAPFQWIR